LGACRNQRGFANSDSESNGNTMIVLRRIAAFLVVALVPAIDIVTVQRVEYSDGTSWELATPQPSMTPSVAPTATAEP
jgi:hypothetical protein